jgi:hypothetical protein
MPTGIQLEGAAWYSSTMTTIAVQDIGLKAAQMRVIEKRARHQGLSPAEYVRRMIERDLLAEETFDEILRPIREDVRRSGLTEAQLDDIVNRARRATSRKTSRSRR